MSSQSIYSNTTEVSFYRLASNLKADAVIGASTVSVYSISQFSINNIILIGEYGSEGSGIIKTHTSTAPTGYVVTLNSALTKNHPKDTPVYILSFDKIEYSHSDTETGDKTVLSTVFLDPERDEMLYEDTTNITGFYFSRYQNSITSVYSDYSDPIPYAGLPNNTVGYAVDTAMTELGVRFTEKLTFNMVIGFAKQMLRLVRGKMRSWSKYQEFNYVVGTVSRGVRSFAMPDTCYDKNSDRSILNLSIGSATPLTYIDRSEYLQATEEAVYTEVATQCVIGATSFVLDNTSNLSDTGSIYVYVSGTQYTIEYTANDKTTNTLTIGADQVTATLPVDSQVWSGITEETPTHYSVWDENIYLWPMIPASMQGQDLVMDFYTDIEDINSQMDVVKGTKYDMLIPYLKYKIRAIVENNGKEDPTDPNNLEFRELLNDAKMNDASAERNAFRPRGASIFGGRKHNSRR